MLDRQQAEVVAAVLLCSLFGACAAATLPTKEPARNLWEGRGRECVRPFLGRTSPYSEIPGGNGDARVLASVPPEARRTVQAAGLASLVGRALAGASEATPTLDQLSTKQELGMRLISLETQLAAVIFEAECTGELIEAMNFELEDRSDLRDLRLALGSLVVGALSATVAGVWDLRAGDSNGPAVLGLVGGVGSAALGGAAFVKHPQSMQYDHDHNLLAPVVAGADPNELFPRFVFSLLMLSPASGQQSPRERLLERWRELIAEVVPRHEREAAEALLFGSGGMYNQELLAARERMYDALETELNALSRDLELLDRFLVHALERREVTEAGSAPLRP